MRPTILNPLFAEVTALDAVGPKVAVLLGRLLNRSESPARVIDLLFHVPVAVIDRSQRRLIAEAPGGAIATLKVRVDRHQPGPPSRRARAPYRVLVHDDSGELALVYFHANRSWLERTLPVGKIVYVSGEVEWFNGRPQIVHPDYVVPEADEGELPLFEPVYPLTAGLAKKTLLKAIASAVSAIPTLPEWIPPGRLKAGHWPSFGEAVAAAHRPESSADLEPTSVARVRLAYDELFADQLALALTRSHMRRSPGKVRTAPGKIADALRKSLPFKLTADQERAIGDINSDLGEPQRMLRLLQGDVGSGKTVVALMAMATVIEAGGQAALMAPTEILARQHEATIRPLAESAGLRVAILTGREAKRDRDNVLADLIEPTSRDGDLLGGRRGVDILIGTHALFQENVRFHDLALAVIDEQHRFGVQQRLALAAKGDATDVLVMTATPIPRSLVLTSFGDMDVSQLREKPAGRKSIETRAVSMDRMGEVVKRLQSAVAAGGRVFWVCPLVEDSEDSNLTSAESRAAELTKTLGQEIGLVHGQMTVAEKDAAMERFRSGATPVLVATTVIEVGVDVPDASIMVIEHAERFGLAQLHQLRGRVGRSDKPSTCLLLYKPPLGDTARARLNILRESNDGFLIAEEDLRLRGGGEVLGTRQSGLPGFRLADLEHHQSVLEAARDDAREIVAAGAALAGERGDAIRDLLYLFGRDAAIRLLRAG